jgi:hypothetical protein
MKRYNRPSAPAIGLWAALLAATAAPVSAAEPSFYGTWAITEAKVAPWANAQHDAFGQREQRRLIGTRVIFRPAQIVAPSPLRCYDPHYAMTEAPPDYLFQGGLTDAAAQARALGFRAPSIPTLQTGCGADFEYHFLDDRTALFALNNMIYTLRKK